MEINHCIERARGRDPSAVAALVEALRPRIVKMAAYYARCCGEDPDDLLQEAWVGLLEALPSLDLRIGAPEQYLIQCARWRLLDAIKHARVRRTVPLEDSAINSVAHPNVPAEDSAYLSEFTGQLNATQRAVLDCLLEGLTWREAGHTLGCTSANIAYHVRKIRRCYREWVTGSAPVSARVGGISTVSITREGR